MRYYCTREGGKQRLIARDDSNAYDVTATRPSVTTFGDLAHVADVASETIDEVTNRLIDEAEPHPIPDETTVDIPLLVDEVWAAGVTYEISEQAREDESGMPEIYLDVYEADRPEIFFKSTRSRVVAPGDSVGIRGDSEWNVPEPELGVVLHNGDTVGYTIGNDMSSRSIEGANPLYLPQAKVYDRSCSLGPCIVTPDTIDDPHNLEMQMQISRDDELLYEDTTSTSEMVRTCEELVTSLTDHNTIPETTVLLTGTSLVPEDNFTLEPDDRIDIDMEGIGRLSNTVTTV